MKNKFSKHLTGFRKNHNTQNSLLKMIESRKAKLNNSSKIGVIIMDLSKAFDNLNHDGSKIGVIIMDLSKAFDSLNNDVLLAKLEAMV